MAPEARSYIVRRPETDKTARIDIDYPPRMRLTADNHVEGAGPVEVDVAKGNPDFDVEAYLAELVADGAELEEITGDVDA